MFGIAVGHQNIALRDGGGQQKGAGFNAIGNDSVLGAMEALDALHFDDG